MHHRHLPPYCNECVALCVATSRVLQALFDQYIDANSLVTGMEKEEASVLRSKRVTPKMFAHSIKQKCIANPQRIVLPEVRQQLEAGHNRAVQRRAGIILGCMR